MGNKLKTKVAVLMGGPSSEHEVSLDTGKMIAKNLNRKKFEILPIKIEKSGTWPITVENLKKKIDIAFVALHGEYGEDGQVQSLLETFGVPYTGSDPVVSALTMDKQKTSCLLSKSGFLVPEAIFIHKNNPDIDWAAFQKFKMPVVVKPTDRGSSVGVTIVKDLNSLGKAINHALKYSDSIMIERYIKGREVTGGILEINQTHIPLLPTEIIPKMGKFFDYSSKYEVGGSDEITPPNLPAKTIKLIQLTALKAHKLFNCSGMSRTDMILDHKGKLHVLEINTIPGMTKTSLLPQAAQKMGIDFSSLLEIIVKSGLRKK